MINLLPFLLLTYDLIRVINAVLSTPPARKLWPQQARSELRMKSKTLHHKMTIFLRRARQPLQTMPLHHRRLQSKSILPTSHPSVIAVANVT